MWETGVSRCAALPGSKVLAVRGSGSLCSALGQAPEQEPPGPGHSERVHCEEPTQVTHTQQGQQEKRASEGCWEYGQQSLRVHPHPHGPCSQGAWACHLPTPPSQGRTPAGRCPQLRCTQSMWQCGRQAISVAFLLCGVSGMFFSQWPDLAPRGTCDGRHQGSHGPWQSGTCLHSLQTGTGISKATCQPLLGCPLSLDTVLPMDSQGVLGMITEFKCGHSRLGRVCMGSESGHTPAAGARSWQCSCARAPSSVPSLSLCP